MENTWADTEEGLESFIEIEVAEMEYEGTTHNNDLEPVLSPTGAGLENAGRTSTYRSKMEEWDIINKCNVTIYSALFYIDWSISEWGYD